MVERLKQNSSDSSAQLPPSSTSGGTPEAARREKSRTMTNEIDGISIGMLGDNSLKMDRESSQNLSTNSFQRESLDQSGFAHHGAGSGLGGRGYSAMDISMSTQLNNQTMQ